MQKSKLAAILAVFAVLLCFAGTVHAADGSPRNRYRHNGMDGHGQQDSTEIYCGHVVVPNLIPKVEIKIGVNEEFVDITVDTILQAARHGANGKTGEGKIFIAPLEECIRISTGRRGGEAI